MEPNKIHLNSQRGALLSYLKEYDAFHQNPVNVKLHGLAVYPIVVATLGLLWRLGFESLPWLNAGLGLWIGVSIWYFKLSPKVAITLLFPTGLCLYLGTMLSWPLLVLIFALGWGVQFVGHFVFEKNSPALFKTLVHLWIAPLWLWIKWTGIKV